MRLRNVLKGENKLIFCLYLIYIICLFCVVGCGQVEVNERGGRHNEFVRWGVPYTPEESEVETEETAAPDIEPPETDPPEPETEPPAPINPFEYIASQWTYLDDIYAQYIAKAIYIEYNGDSDTERAAVVWCILNRVDSKIYPNDIISVVTAPYQFQGYKEDNPVIEEYFAMAKDVMIRWYAEKRGVRNVGRILPKTYLFFIGDIKREHNWYSEVYLGTDYWDWSLASPYED